MPAPNAGSEAPKPWLAARLTVRRMTLPGVTVPEEQTESGPLLLEPLWGLTLSGRVMLRHLVERRDPPSST